SSALDILVPKAGFFCQICSLFYADEPSMINHCRTPLHRQNMEVPPGKTGISPQILRFGGAENSLR
ncbi:ZN638 protein, partial [Eulacestoma nigropectus]|nr:ZN638 protein [Eulacestoma nigropectus]